MPLTYTEIEQEKNTQILVFFLVVVLFYFFTALVVGSLVKGFFHYYVMEGRMGSPLLGPSGLLLSLAIALVAAAIHIGHSMNNAMARVRLNLGAEDIDPQDNYHREFASVVDEVNVATGARYKITPVIIPSVALNAFSMADRKGNALVGATEGLLAKLNRQQLQAVVAHEVAHVATGDSFQTTIGCSLFGIFAATAHAALHGARAGGRVRVGRRGKGAGAIVVFLFLLFLVLSVTQFFYSLIRFSLSRDRELRADAVAVRLTRDPIALSEALYKISRGWRGFGQIDKNFSTLFIMNPAKEARDEREGFMDNLFSTHPPIRKRMKILAEMAHTDIAHVIRDVLSQVREQEAAREIPAEPGAGEPSWMLRDDQDNWKGPFTVSQAMVLGWLTPATWVKRFGGEAANQAMAALPGDAAAGSILGAGAAPGGGPGEATGESIGQARDEPLLAPVFDARLGGANVSKFTCPTCNQKLIDDDYEGAPIHRCAFCHGTLVDRRKMTRIALRTEKGFSERLARLAELTQKNGQARRNEKAKLEPSPFNCPNCNSEMRRGFYTYQYLVEVDKCTRCTMVWLDKDELEIIQYLIEHSDSAAQERGQ
jgi:heat shock protein HtpX